MVAFPKDDAFTQSAFAQDGVADLGLLLANSFGDRSSTVLWKVLQTKN